MQAQDLCGLGDFRFYDVDECRPHLPHQAADVDVATLTYKVLQVARVPRFGQRYRQRIQEAENLRICLYARAVRLETNSGGDLVHAVTAHTCNGRRFRIAARAFVLAAGGIENPRLLLCSDDAHPNGLANGNDLVGRFFMEHPFVDIPLGRSDHDRAALLSVRREPRRNGTLGAWTQLVLSDELLRAERVNAISVWVDRPRLPWRAGRAKVLSLLQDRSRLQAWPSGSRILCEAREAAQF
ncbi:MAG: hypothetical protein ACRDL7_14935, partial [Gaiellaceae bacterium]